MWHKLSNKKICFPSKSSTVLITNINLDWWEPNKYSLISVDKLLDICDKPYCQWTHWMVIPEIKETQNCCLTCRIKSTCYGKSDSIDECDSYIEDYGE